LSVMTERVGMYGELKHITAGAAFALALVATPAVAADLGGNCCADLEERIAELEATTARKGNRKVSLEIYGQVNEGLLFWDDGRESNVGVYTNDNARSRIGFRGKAKINGDLEAGYRIEIGIRSQNSKRFSQVDPDASFNPADNGLDLRDSHWFLKSKTYGQASVGLQASATDQITEINQTQTKDFAKYSDIEDTGLGLLLRSARSGGLTTSIPQQQTATTSAGEGGVTWRRLIGDGGDQPGEGERRYNLVKYETPEFKGFTASAAWGEDDFWDVALRYSGEFVGVKLVAGIGYGEQSDGFYLDTKTVCSGRAVGNPSNDQKCSQFGGSFSAIHEKSGLFVNAGAGIKFDDAYLGKVGTLDNSGVDDEQTFWAVQAGIERKFNDLGKTTVYGEYYDYDGGNGRRGIVAGDALLTGTGILGPADIFSTEVNMVGFGIAQGIDKAALTLYLSYRHVEGDLKVRERAAPNVIADAPIEDLDLVFGGGVIRF
jgi:predicted porin